MGISCFNDEALLVYYRVSSWAWELSQPRIFITFFHGLYYFSASISLGASADKLRLLWGVEINI